MIRRSSTSTAGVVAHGATLPTAVAAGAKAERPGFGGWAGGTFPAVIDVRLIRSDPDAVKAALGRRGEDLDADRPGGRPGPPAAGPGPGAGRGPRTGSRPCPRRSAASAGTARSTRPRPSRPRAGPWRAGGGAGRRGRGAGRPSSATSCSQVPNLPSPDAPDGAGEDDNPVLRTGGPDPDGYAEHQRVPHWETGEALGILDVERGVKLAGSMFVAYRGLGATLLPGALPARPGPQRRPLRGGPAAVAGPHRDHGRHRPAAEVQRRRLPPRARRPLGHPHRRGAADLALPGRDPRRGRAARCASWPTPRASVGRRARPAATPAACCGSTSSTRSSCWPSPRPTRRRTCRSRSWRGPRPWSPTSGLAYRVIDICTGDLGIAHHRSWDLEVWSPGLGQWLEVSSVSWFSDYQARRANLRYRPTEGKGTELLHTLNGSGLAVPRVLGGDPRGPPPATTARSPCPSPSTPTSGAPPRSPSPLRSTSPGAGIVRTCSPSRRRR